MHEAQDTKERRRQQRGARKDVYVCVCVFLCACAHVCTHEMKLH